jgi:hypothetical protein
MSLEAIKTPQTLVIADEEVKPNCYKPAETTPQSLRIDRSFSDFTQQVGRQTSGPSSSVPGFDLCHRWTTIRNISRTGRGPGAGRFRTVLYTVEACLVFAAKIWPTRVAKGISSAAYRSLAKGLALSFRISTIVLA